MMRRIEKAVERSAARIGVMRAAVSAMVLAALVLSAGCGDETEPPTAGPTEIRDDEQTGEVFIVDRTGKRWEVSHAQENYGMEPDLFQFGLGPEAIRPINDPVLIGPDDPSYPAADAAFLVLGTEIGGDARAYRISTLSNAEVANESFGGTHVAVAYWPLVDLAAVYSREIDGMTLTLAASGWTYDYTFVLYDHQTESLWYHVEGTTGLTCVSGHFADRRLEELTSTKTRWSTWHSSHPGSPIMK